MISKRTSFLLVGVLTAFISTALFAGDFKGHPHLRKAHHKVEEALKDLQEAKNGVTSDPFGGHRDKAEQLLQQAFQEIDAAGQYAESHPGGH